MRKYFIKLNLDNKSLQKGMTLVELLVVLAIFVIVAGLTIFDYGRFRSSVAVQNLADDMALSIRRTQNYAIGVQNAQAQFSNGYGIHFTTLTGGVPLAGSNKSFIMFNDIPVSGIANQQYDYSAGGGSSSCNFSTVSAGNECVDLLSITSNAEIKSICPNGAGCTSGYVDIVFLRPEPTAYIKFCNSSGSCVSSLSSVDIVISDFANQSIKTITVSRVGQISIR